VRQGAASIAVAMCGAAFFAADSGAAHTPDRGNALRTAAFCGRPELRQYEAPLRLFGSPSPFPASGRLRGAPSTVRVSNGRDFGRRVWLVGSRPTIAFENVGRRVARLDWYGEIAVSRVFRDGRQAIAVSQTTDFVDEVGAAVGSQIVGPAVGRGFFDIEYRLSNHLGGEIAEFSETVRVMRSTTRARLSVERRVIRSGGVLRLRIDNLGTRTVTASLGIDVSRRVRGRWIKVRPEHPAFGLRYGVRGGEAGRCESLRFSRDAPAGLYRIRKKIHPEGVARSRGRVLKKVVRVRMVD
jgi:hypothetical protein